MMTLSRNNFFKIRQNKDDETTRHPIRVTFTVVEHL